jgi:hypothetical protein
MWIKLGILLTGFAYAGLLPYTLKRALQNIDIDLKSETLSFLSNKSLYDKKYVKAYTEYLFAVAILLYIFFWLLSEYYDLGQYEHLMKLLDYCCLLFTMLAFIPHNIEPYSFKRLKKTMQRLIHNILGGLVFLALPSLIIFFQITIMKTMPFLGISGLVIIGVVVITSAISLFTKGITGLTELLFMNGISIWGIYVTIITILS